MTVSTPQGQIEVRLADIGAPQGPQFYAPARARSRETGSQQGRRDAVRVAHLWPFHRWPAELPAEEMLINECEGLKDFRRENSSTSRTTNAKVDSDRARRGIRRSQRPGQT